MIYRKPANLKYVDLCIWVDANVDKLLPAGANPDIENQIWNYLWLILKAISIKKQMFENYSDYDGFSFYGATRIYNALRNNLNNRGKIIKGKEIKPIKSCLNYMKALLYPMKLEYLHQEYESNLSTAIINQKFNVFKYKEKLKGDICSSQGGFDRFRQDVSDLITHLDTILNDVLKKSPFEQETADYKKLKISVMMNCLENLKKKKSLNFEPQTIIVWKMPKSTSTYVRLFIKAFGAAIKKEIMDAYRDCIIPDDIVSYIISNPDGEFNNNNEN